MLLITLIFKHRQLEAKRNNTKSGPQNSAPGKGTEESMLILCTTSLCHTKEGSEGVDGISARQCKSLAYGVGENKGEVMEIQGHVIVLDP